MLRPKPNLRLFFERLVVPILCWAPGSLTRFIFVFLDRFEQLLGSIELPHSLRILFSRIVCIHPLHHVCNIGVGVVDSILVVCIRCSSKPRLRLLEHLLIRDHHTVIRIVIFSLDAFNEGFCFRLDRINELQPRIAGLGGTYSFPDAI